jgi:hypothetical protein
MAEAEKSNKKQPPRGGRKGGTLFPKIKLQQATEYAKKLVSKTHTGPLSAKTILPGVFGNAGPIGQVRASALKQYGFLEGTVEEYNATQLAKDLDAAPDDEASIPLLQQALLTSKTFWEIFQTFQGDTVSKAKIVQRAKGLKVHPDSAEECADIFIDSAITAKLGSGAAGDSIVLIRSTGTASPAANAASATNAPAADQEPEDEVSDESEDDTDQGHQSNTQKGAASIQKSQARAKAIVNLTLTVDSSSDPDKLEKQLKLLRQFGML